MQAAKARPFVDAPPVSGVPHRSWSLLVFVLGPTHFPSKRAIFTFIDEWRAAVSSLNHFISVSGTLGQISFSMSIIKILVKLKFRLY